MIKLSSIKTQLIIFLCAFALFLIVKDKDAVFVLSLLQASIFAAVIEAFILYLRNKRFEITESSLISGLIIGFVLSGDASWMIFLAAAALAIISKHLIRFRDRHIFNPAGFGIFLVCTFFGAQTQWQGTYYWQILVPAGLYFSYKIRKLEVLAGYFITALGLFAIQAALQKTALLNIFGYLSYFYIFIMVIEPKTTPVVPIGKFVFGAGVALLIFIFTEAGVRFDAELAALLALNLFVPLLNKLKRREA